MSKDIQLYRGDVFYFTASPLEKEDAYCFFPDGLLAVSGGKVVEAGNYDAIQGRYPDAPVTDYSGRLIMPGLIDSHIHYSQSEIPGMYGCQLLDWLNDYTFPAEKAFASPQHAAEIARFFVRELLKNGTTTCMAYATVHPASVDALFRTASEYNMCMLAGKVLMNNNAPEALLDTTESGEAQTRALIEAWHGKGRNRYVITPRFAYSSTADQLASVGRLHREYPDTYIQTHLSENKTEVDSVLSLHPGHSHYLEVYERAGILTDRTVFGHCIHLSEDECRMMAAADAVVAHCPTSNLFLGSGLFDMKQADRFGIHTTLATDVGGGTSFSMLRTMGESYKVQQLNGYPVTALELLYRCTLGTARALHLNDRIGSFEPGCDADFIVVDTASTASQQLRKDYLQRTGQWNVSTMIFGLQILGDDRAVTATYLMGNRVV